MRKLIVALVVLLALLAVADRVLVSAAEGVVARRVQVAAGLEREPTVEIRGFPFLTQAVAGEYDRVDISLGAMERDDMRLRDLTVRLKQVHAPLGRMLSRDGSASVRSESARASVLVPYGMIEQRMPVDADVQREGERLRLSGEVSVLGQQLPASAIVEPSVANGQLVFEAAEVQAGGRAVSDRLADTFSFTVDVGELPFGLRIDGARAADGGLRVTARGADVLLSGAAAAAGEPSAGGSHGDSLPDAPPEAHDGSDGVLLRRLVTAEPLGRRRDA